MSRGSAPTAGEGCGWTARLAFYHQPSSLRSTLEITLTVVPFVTLWVDDGGRGVWGLVGARADASRRRVPRAIVHPAA